MGLHVNNWNEDEQLLISVYMYSNNAITETLECACLLELGCFLRKKKFEEGHLLNTVLNSLLFIMVSSRLVHTAISYRVVCNQNLSICTQFESVCTRNTSRASAWTDLRCYEQQAGRIKRVRFKQNSVVRTCDLLKIKTWLLSSTRWEIFSNKTVYCLH